MSLDQVIQFRQIDVRTELADEVSDGEPLIFSLIEPGFFRWDQIKKTLIPFHDHVASCVRQVERLNQMPEAVVFWGRAEVAEFPLMGATQSPPNGAT